MATCTDFKYRHYNGGWSDWSSKLYDGYAGRTKYVAVLSFKTPEVEELHTNTHLDITIPWIRQSWASKSGMLYVKLLTSDPTASEPKPSTIIPTENTCDAASAWSANDLSIHTSDFTIAKDIEPNTVYYLTIGCSEDFLEIGYSKLYHDLYVIDYDYSVYTAVGKGTVTITDHYNNTFSISGTKGKDGTNNPASGPVITWGYTNSYTESGAVSEKALTIKTKADATRTIYAKSVTKATHGSDAIVTATKSIKQYVAPGIPGVPVISYTKSRLTIKEPWTFTWTASKATNTSSPVKGYRIKIYKNNTPISGLIAGSGNNIILTTGGTNTFLDRDSTSTSIIIDPIAFGFKAGDTIKVGIFAYTKYGESNTGTRLFDSAATEAVSTIYTVQNAGVIDVKVNGTWVEGQVYVKAEGVWHEAETVYAKAAGAWKESQ